ncbi:MULTISPECIES: hypothetical protein [unclassified Paenibacillus]|uniref:Uncharacterized protein n=1 Tax=Paenibacillus provencensis TaxID=441151 RepID=A0ABW3PWS7_9BACL|nr:MULTISPECIES: hypothetical protein [unclassified Paenibacillus]MCM3128738.1 hypothetical protein [Paenibacillus sp. MER 78]
MTTLFGTIRINFVFGLIGLVYTFFVSYSSNLLSTSLYRAGTAFVIWFVIAFICRWVLGYVLAPSQSAGDHSKQNEEKEHKGTQLDITAPDDDEELRNLLKYSPQEESVNEPKKSAAKTGFEPLNPPKLVRTKDAEELAKAVRHLSDN